MTTYVVLYIAQTFGGSSDEETHALAGPDHTKSGTPTPIAATQPATVAEKNFRKLSR